MDRRSLSVVACLIALGGVGMYFYERQLIELRGELEEARLREAQAVAAMKKLRETRGEALPLEKHAPDIDVKRVAERGTARPAGERVPPSEADRRSTEEARQAAERARSEAERAAESHLPRFYKEPYRPGGEPHRPGRPPVEEGRAAERFARAQSLEAEGKGAEAGSRSRD